MEVTTSKMEEHLPRKSEEAIAQNWKNGKLKIKKSFQKLLY